MNRLGIIVSVAICWSVILISCACPSSTPTQSPESPSTVDSEYAEQLAKQFCPIIYLKGEGEAPENYEPEPVEIMVDQASVRDIQDPSFSEKATLSGLLQWSRSIYYLDILGLGPATQSPEEYELNYQEVKDQYQPTIYARVSEGIDTGYTVVQYWIFYYFNDWRNLHEGDWELVQICFPGYTVQELVENGEQPVFVAYSQHQAGQKMSWGNMIENGLVLETHPIVYVSKGSHANYFTPGNFWSGLDFDDTGLSSWQIINPEQFNIVMLPETEVGKEELDWLDFKGYWGEYLGFSIDILGLKFWQHGPFGPPWSDAEQKNERWEYPYEWADGLPEYPKPFWTSFFKQLGDWVKLAIFSLFSPADLHIYDSTGRHVGIDKKGKLEKQIPGAVYIAPEGTDYKIILIPDADVSDEYMIEVKGTGTGTMDIRAQVPDAESKLKRFLEYTKVPVSAKTKARATIKPVIPSAVRVPSTAEIRGGTKRDTTTKLEIDSDGDGVFESESIPGKFKGLKATPRPTPAQGSPPPHTPTPAPDLTPPTQPVETTPDTTETTTEDDTQQKSPVISENDSVRPGDSPWPMFHGNLPHTGLSLYDTSHIDGTEKWSFETGAGIESSPAIGVDGTIYFGSHDGFLYAVSPDGTEKWRFDAGPPSYDERWNVSKSIMASPAIAPDGTIYIYSSANYLFAINPDGTERWRFYLKWHNDFWSCPTIGPDGTIYIGSARSQGDPDFDGGLHAINPDGTEKWLFSDDSGVTSSAAIGADGTIYFGGNVGNPHGEGNNG